MAVNSRSLHAVDSVYSRAEVAVHISARHCTLMQLPPSAHKWHTCLSAPARAPP